MGRKEIKMTVEKTIWLTPDELEALDKVIDIADELRPVVNGDMKDALRYLADFMDMYYCLEGSLSNCKIDGNNVGLKIGKE